MEGISKKGNMGAQVSINRSKAQRAANREIIKALPNFKTGFTREDIPLLKSVANRELQDMTKDGLLVVTRKANTVNTYRAAPDFVWRPTQNNIPLGRYFGYRSEDHEQATPPV